MGFIGQHAACARARAGFQARFGNRHDLARQIMQFHAIADCLQPIHRGRNAQRVAGFCIQPCQIPRGIQRDWSYVSPTQSAGSAQSLRHGPPSAPRISMNFLTRASGKMVVR
jgi:hypothetical protein